VEIGDEEATAMVPQFLKEGQSSNGVVLTMNRNTDGLEQYEKGIQLSKPFLCWKINSIDWWMGSKTIEEEISCVKFLGIKSGWVTNSRAKGLFWEDNLLIEDPGVGKVLGRDLKFMWRTFWDGGNWHGRNCGYSQK